MQTSHLQMMQLLGTQVLCRGQLERLGDVDQGPHGRSEVGRSGAGVGAGMQKCHKAAAGGTCLLHSLVPCLAGQLLHMGTSFVEGHNPTFPCFKEARQVAGANALSDGSYLAESQ